MACCQPSRLAYKSEHANFAGKLQPSSSGKPPKPRRTSSAKGKAAAADLPSHEDVFDVFCMLQPDEEGCVSIRSINDYQQKLGMHFDEETLSLMIALAQQLPAQQPPGSFRQELAEGAGRGVRKLGLEHFQRLVQFLEQPRNVTATRKGSGGKADAA